MQTAWKNILSGAKYFALNLYFRAYILAFGYKRIKRHIGEVDGPPAPPWEARRVGWFVFKTAKPIPGATCLSRAMTAQYILKRHGFGSSLCVGVAQSDKAGDKGLLAHAWVMSGDQVVVGNESGELERYKLLTRIGASVP